MFFIFFFSSCAEKIRIKKDLIFEMPDFYASMKHENPELYNKRVRNILYAAGKRYAYMYPLNDSVSVLNMNGVTVIGDFNHWYYSWLYSGCSIGDYKVQNQHVQPDPSLTTFIIKDKNNNNYIYIDGKKVSENLSKTYPPYILKGIWNIDTAIYILTRDINIKVLGKDRNENGVQFTKRISNFYFKGKRGPDFINIRVIKMNPGNNSYIYIGKQDFQKKYAVINGDIYKKYPLEKYPWERESLVLFSKFNEPYFIFDDSLKGKKGYWINGKTTPCFNQVTDIRFRSKDVYEFIGINNKIEYYLITNDSVSRKYKFIKLFNNDRILSKYSNTTKIRKIMVSKDSVYCYENDKLIFHNKFYFTDHLLYLSYEFTADTHTVVLRGWQYSRSFFLINDSCYITTLPSKFGFLGFSESRKKYAWFKYLEDSVQNLGWKLIYVNDSLIGKYPQDVTLTWTSGDNYFLSYIGGKFINLYNEFNSDFTMMYKRYIKLYFPDSVPEYIHNIKSSWLEYKVKFIEDKIKYIKSRNKFIFDNDTLIMGSFENMEFHCTDNGIIYYSSNDVMDEAYRIDSKAPVNYYTSFEKDFKERLFINFKEVYKADNILRISDRANIISFYSVEGNKVFFNSINLN